MFNCWHSGNSVVDLAGSSEGGCRAWWERWNLCFRYMRTWLLLRLAPPRTWHRVFFIVMSRQHHHNTRGRRVNYVAMNGGNGEVEDSQDELLEEQEPPSDWEDHVASDSAAVQRGFTSSMAAQHSAAAPLGRASPLEMDDAELDHRLAAAEDESIRLEREGEKARKIRRLAELEGRNRERRRRIHEDAQAPERPEPRGLPPAAEPRRQRTVNMADLRQEPHVDRRAGALLRTLSLVSDSDSEPDCVASNQRRRSTKRGRRLRSGMEARATDVVVNPWGQSTVLASCCLALRAGRQVVRICRAGPKVTGCGRVRDYYRWLCESLWKGGAFGFTQRRYIHCRKSGLASCQKRLLSCCA